MSWWILSHFYYTKAIRSMLQRLSNTVHLCSHWSTFSSTALHEKFASHVIRFDLLIFHLDSFSKAAWKGSKYFCVCASMGVKMNTASLPISLKSVHLCCYFKSSLLVFSLWIFESPSLTLHLITLSIQYFVFFPAEKKLQHLSSGSQFVSKVFPALVLAG